MPILGDLYPRPQADGELIRAWESIVERVETALRAVDSGTERARRGGSQFKSQLAGFDQAVNRVTSAIGSARPGQEKQFVAGASRSGPGVRSFLVEAVQKATAPDTDPGAIDVGQIARTAEELRRLILGGSAHLGQLPDPTNPPPTPPEL